MRSALALLAASLTLVSCGPGRLSTVEPPPRARPVDVKPVRDAVTRASVAVVKAREEQARADVQIDRAERSAADAAAIAQKAFVDGVAAGSEAAIQLKIKVAEITFALSEAKTSLMTLARHLSKTNEELENTKGELGNVQAAAAAKEQENATVRGALDQANVRLKAADKVADDLVIQKTKTSFWKKTTLAGFLSALLIAAAWRVFG